MRTLKAFFLILGVLILAQSCKKDYTGGTDNQAEQFTQLNISPSFNFESFRNIQTSIQLGSTRMPGGEIIRIYDQHPAQGGKLIMTGNPNQQGEFNLPVRIASRLEEVYIARLNAMGMNEYVAVPLQGTTLAYTFGSKETSLKAVDPFCDCEAADILPDNFNSNLVIPNGETRCVAAGNHASIKDLTIRPGGYLKICGTATVNKYRFDSREGTILVSPSGSLTLTKRDLNFSLTNYGTINISGNGTHNFDGYLENWGTVNSTVKIVSRGDIINHGTYSSSKDFELVASGLLVNHCKFLLTTNNADFKQNGRFTNNGYLHVKGEAEFNGTGNTSNETILGQGSLIATKEFKINGDIEGPAGGYAQIKASDEGRVNSSADLRNLDLCADEASYSNNADYTNVTYCAITVSIPDCESFAAPEITSSLQIGGLAGEALQAYTITASGTQPLSFSTGNLPAGLSFNASTAVISGTPLNAGTYQVSLTASNAFGQDTQTLVIIITEPVAAPVITSVLTKKTTVNEAFLYIITASGSGPITYGATNLPAGLTLDTSTGQISGNPGAAGVYTIGISATNAGGTTTENLVLTVGTPPAITNVLTASGTAGDQFESFVISVSGTPAISVEVSNLPQNLSYNPDSRTIDGTPLFPGIFEVTLLAVNEYGSDVQTLVITIAEGIQAPQINSSLSASATSSFPFSYTITASGSQPMTFTASGLPEGLSVSGNIISGIPQAAGNFQVQLGATNAAGTDTRVLQLQISQGSADDSDGDGIADNLDDYPEDPLRAFNSYYPNEADYVSIAFEDLWPAYGDYDFNDFVINLNYKIISNAQNAVVDIEISYQIRAAGASLDNGFGIAFNALPEEVDQVQGTIRMGNAIMTDPKGFEAGHTTETVVILIDQINPIMEGGMANTVPGGKYVQTTLNTVSINFSSPQSALGLPPYNPFIFVDQVRSHEVHLKNHKPTSMADPELFGTANDNSDPSADQYYSSPEGLPWGIETAVNFDYPIENADIVTVHLKFAAWAQSSGQEYPDWYLDQPGYRDDAGIYVRPE